MAFFRKHFRWGLSVLAILHHFTTPEMRALLKHCRKLIREYCNAAYEGEGYCASIITFEMFEYGFVFAYNYDDEEWVLEVVTFPDWGSPHCKRKPPRDNANIERAIETLDNLRRPRMAWLIEDVREMLYETRALGPTLNKFWEDIGSGGNIRSVMKMLRKILLPQALRARSSPIIELFTRLAEQQSHDYSDLVQLVRARVNDAVGFLEPLWTFPFRRATRVTFEGLWDVSLFGALPEQASG
jgi:hypothetical protein